MHTQRVFGYILTLTFGFLMISGCSETGGTNDVVPQADVTAVPENDFDPAEEALGREMIAHIKNYLVLKAEDPDAAYVELRKAADIFLREHQLAEEWTQLVFKIDVAGKATLPEMIRKYEIELAVAQETSPYEEYIQHVESELSFWQEKREAIEAKGQDPELMEIKFRMVVVDD